MKIILPFKVKMPILACGADLKGAFAFARGGEAFLLDGFGDLGDLDNFTRYEKAVRRYAKTLGIKPKMIVCDLHPGYFSTRFAENSKLQTQNSELFKVQHHEAHVASAIVDNSIKGKVIGVAFDGTGFGSDGNIWGGEFFIGELKNFKRVAHLEYMPMPGADLVIKEPWRMAASYLYKTFGDASPNSLKIDRKKQLILKSMIERNINSPLTSSMGRLFDAAASVILSKDEAAFEAELPIELEKMAVDSCNESYGFGIKTSDGPHCINSSKMIRGIVKDLSRKMDKSVIATKFHNTIADMILKVSSRLRRQYKIKKVVLSGGVFQNRYLTKKSVAILRKNGFKVYTHSTVPTNDGGIAIGQIAIANARLKCA